MVTTLLTNYTHFKDFYVMTTTTLRLNKTSTLEALQAAKLRISSQLGTKMTNDDLIMYLLSTTVSKSEQKVDTSVDYCIYNLDTSVSTVDTLNFVSLSEYNETLEAFTRMAADVHKLLEFRNSILDLDLTTVKLKGIANSAKLNVIEDKLGI